MLEGMNEDLIITIDSYDYHVDFVVLQPKVYFWGYPLILGRPWLTINDVFIGCRSRSMIISTRDKTK